MRMIWNRRRSILAAVAMGSLLMQSSFASSLTEIKTIALNPGGYLGRTLRIEGVIRAMGPGESWFILEDDTGRVLVTTVQIGTSFFCEPGARAVIDGELAFLGEEHGLYFSMKELKSCSLPTQPVAYHFARSYLFLKSLF